MFAVESIDPRLGRLEAYQVVWSGLDGQKQTYEMDLVPCETLLTMSQEQKLDSSYSHARLKSQSREKTEFLCLDPQADMKIEGTFNSAQFDYIKLSLKRCNQNELAPEETCVDQSEITPKLIRIYLPEPSINYDEKDHNNALSFALNGFYALQLDSNIRRKQDIFVSQSEIYFESKWALVELEQDGKQFVEFTGGSSWIENVKFDADGDASYSDIYFRVASKKRVYSLEPYKILDLLGDLGGLLDIMFAFGTILTMWVAKRAFDRSLLSDAYQVQGKAVDKAELYKSKTARKWFDQKEQDEQESPDLYVTDHEK